MGKSVFFTENGLKKGAVSIVAAALLGAACMAGTAEAAEKVHLDFWYSLRGKNGEFIAELTDKFNKSQSAIEVKAISQGDYYQNAAKLQSSIVSNTQPDVTLLEVAQVGQFGYSGALADLGPWFAEKEQANFLEGLMKNSYIDGKFVAVPFCRSTPILYVNKSMLKAAGLDEKGPRTWDELVEFSRKLTNAEKGIFGFSTPIDIWFYEAGVFQQGGSIFSADEKKTAFDSPEGTAIVKLWQDMVREGIMKAPVGQDYNAWDVVRNDFATGKTAMVQLSTASLGGLIEVSEGVFELGTAFLPAGKQRGVPTGGACLVVLEKSPKEKRAAAAEFLKFMTNEENAALFSEVTGYMPVTHEAAASERIRALHAKHPQYRVALEQLEHAKTRPMIKGYREMSVLMQEEFKKPMRDLSIDPETSVKAAAAQVQELLDRED